jgi:transcription elongation factor Elf1
MVTKLLHDAALKKLSRSPRKRKAYVPAATLKVKVDNRGKNKPTHDPMTPVSDANVILNSGSLANFIDECFCCKRCHKTGVSVSRKTVGIATSLLYKCNSCGLSSELCPDKVSQPQEAANKYVNPFDHTGRGDRRTLEYDLNVKLAIAMQILGSGGTGAYMLAAILNLSSSHEQLMRSFTQIEEAVGMREIDVTNAILADNFLKECRLLLAKLGVIHDTGWRKRTSSSTRL